LLRALSQPFGKPLRIATWLSASFNACPDVRCSFLASFREFPTERPEGNFR
jgi:hypothetical protein